MAVPANYLPMSMCLERRLYYHKAALAIANVIRQLRVDGGQKIENHWSCLTKTRGQLGANPHLPVQEDL